MTVITLVVVIPAYNEVSTIRAVVEKARRYGEVVVVDDGSIDATAHEARAAGALVSAHTSNRGYDAALETGLAAAAGRRPSFIVTLDADGQHDPASLGKMIDAMESGVELIMGTRPSPARFGEWLFNAYTKRRFGAEDLLCGMKAYSLQLYERHHGAAAEASVGTALALAALRAGESWTSVRINIEPRRDRARFGSVFRANIHILRALVRAIRHDLSHFRGSQR